LKETTRLLKIHFKKVFKNSIIFKRKVIKNLKKKKKFRRIKSLRIVVTAKNLNVFDYTVYVFNPEKHVEKIVVVIIVLIKKNFQKSEISLSKKPKK